MDNDDPTSFSHAQYLLDRAEFERKYEQFLVSLTTPVEARRKEAIETTNRLCEIEERLRRQGVL